MHLRPLSAFALSLAVLAGCAANDLDEPPAPLGDFKLGLNIVVADNMQKVPISRNATVDEWETAIKKAVDERFGRYQGAKFYNFGIAVDAFALAPPGIPLIASPKSALVVTVTLWDDAAQAKLNEEARRFTVFEGTSAESAVLGSGLTRTKEEQMERLARNAVKEIERWMLQNPAWFGIDPAAVVTPVPAVLIPGAPIPAAPIDGVPVAGVPVDGVPLTGAPVLPGAPAVPVLTDGGVITTPLPPVASN